MSQQNFDRDNFLHEYVNGQETYSTTQAAKILRVSLRRLAELLLVQRWFLRRKPWTSLVSSDFAVKAGLVTSPAKIRPAGLIILGAHFGKTIAEFYFGEADDSFFLDEVA